MEGDSNPLRYAIGERVELPSPIFDILHLFSILARRHFIQFRGDLSLKPYVLVTLVIILAVPTILTVVLVLLAAPNYDLFIGISWAVAGIAVALLIWFCPSPWKSPRGSIKPESPLAESSGAAFSGGVTVLAIPSPDEFRLREQTKRYMKLSQFSDRSSNLWTARLLLSMAKYDQQMWAKIPESQKSEFRQIETDVNRQSPSDVLKEIDERGGLAEAIKRVGRYAM